MNTEKQIIALILKSYREGTLLTSDNVTHIRVSDDFRETLKRILKEEK